MSWQSQIEWDVGWLSRMQEFLYVFLSNCDVKLAEDDVGTKRQVRGLSLFHVAFPENMVRENL